MMTGVFPHDETEATQFVMTLRFVNLHFIPAGLQSSNCMSWLFWRHLYLGGAKLSYKWSTLLLFGDLTKKKQHSCLNGLKILRLMLFDETFDVV